MLRLCGKGQWRKLALESGKATSGTAHSDILLSIPPLRMSSPSVEKVAQSTEPKCLNMAMVRRSERRQRRTWLSSDAEATRVPAGFTAMALTLSVWPLQGSPTCFQVDVSQSRIVESQILPPERSRVPSGVHASEKLAA